ncbi:MAG TPA: heavy metal translocating P-type ATPase [Polyangiaceae bacterium]|nr:heavy metal translocating P-type ATPase [Polyangiaceae bacterium]
MTDTHSDPKVRSYAVAAPPVSRGARPTRSSSPPLGTTDRESSALKRRFWTAVAGFVPIAFLELGAGAISSSLRAWLECLLACPAVFYSAAPFFVDAGRSVRRARPDMFALIALGVAAAFGFSVLGLLMPTLLPAAARGTYYFEAATGIVALVLFGQLLELSARRGTRRHLEALQNLLPNSARRVAPDGSEQRVPCTQLLPHDLVRICPGERLAADGLIVEGEGQLDESLLTLEKAPVKKGPKQPVHAGTLNTGGTFTMRAERLGSNTLLSRITLAVSQAQSARGSLQREADRMAAWLIPSVIALALITLGWWLGWAPGVAPDARLAHALVSAIAVLVVACPGALALAAPLSMSIAAGRGADHGLLIRDASGLERLSAVDSLVFDKSGTLTEGKPSVEKVVPADGYESEQVLSLAASLELGSEHPVAAAIVRAARLQKLTLAAVTDFVAQPSGGVSGRVLGRFGVVGSPEFLREQKVDVSSVARAAEGYARAGSTVVFVGALESGFRKCIGFLVLSDPFKKGIHETLRALREEGLELVLLTGDAPETAKSLAAELGIDRVEACLNAVDKASFIEQQRRAGRVVAVVGGGAKDAPALGAADVGFALGTASELAVESAHLTLLKPDLRGLLPALKLARAVRRNVQQNLALAVTYNLVCIPFAAFALYPTFGAVLSPLAASFAMSMSSLSVTWNALRLRSIQL